MVDFCDDRPPSAASTGPPAMISAVLLRSSMRLSCFLEPSLHSDFFRGPCCDDQVATLRADAGVSLTSTVDRAAFRDRARSVAVTRDVMQAPAKEVPQGQAKDVAPGRATYRTHDTQGPKHGGTAPTAAEESPKLPGRPMGKPANSTGPPVKAPAKTTRTQARQAAPSPSNSSRR